MKRWNIGWGAVASCNMKCAFCYSRHKRENCLTPGFDVWKKFVDDNHDLINTINYGTGENTLSKDWFRLVKYIRRHYPFIRQALTTNGYLSEAVKDEFCLSAFTEGIDEVDISLDFSDKALHNAFRGQERAFDWAINTLSLCQKSNKSSTIVFLGSRENIFPSNIDGLFNIAKKYGAILRMNIFRPTFGINDFSKKFIVDSETVVNILKHIYENYSILSIGDSFFSPLLTGIPRPDPSGNHSIRILADGSITPSTYLLENRYILANITKDNVLEELSRNNRLLELTTNILPEECKSCVYRNTCSGGVRDRRYLWYGSLAHKDPYCPGTFSETQTPVLKISRGNFVSIHEDYLPTIFFSPNRDKNISFSEKSIDEGHE